MIGNNTLKPPLGCMPERLYEEQRIVDLAWAINSYVQKGFFKGTYASTVFSWVEELSRRLKMCELRERRLYDK